MTTHNEEVYVPLNKIFWTRAFLRNSAVYRFGRKTLPAGLWLCSVAMGCGSRTTGGNTGSETHWLQACNKDSDCGKYACLCGTCSKGCNTDAQCSSETADLGTDDAAVLCTVTANLGKKQTCEGDVPQKICLLASQTTEPPPVETSPIDTFPDASLPDASPVAPVICDGSEDIRLMYQSSGSGPVAESYAFWARYGWSFLALDGQCNFWATTEVGTFVAGRVTDLALLDVYQSRYYGKLGRFSDYRPLGGCDDAGASYVADLSGITQFVCGATDQPEGWQETLLAVQELLTTLAALGQPSTGPLRVTLEPADPNDNAELWPLDLDPTPILAEAPLTWAEYASPAAGVLFHPGENAELLRAARTEVASRYESVFRYGTDGSSFMQVFFSDELPPHVYAALDGAQRSFYAQDVAGVSCSDAEDCASYGATCAERSAAAGGGTECHACIAPNDPDWLCRSNDDCCGNVTCCVDCGEMSGRCIAEPDPCPTCLENGGSWLLGRRMCDTSECVPDSDCVSTCPGECTPTNCAGCGRLEECWAAECQWDDGSEHQFCHAPPSMSDAGL